MSRKATFDGSTEKANCQEIGIGDLVVDDGDVGAVTFVDPTEQYVEGVNLDKGRIFSKSVESDGDDGVLLLDRVEKGSIAVDQTS